MEAVDICNIITCRESILDPVIKKMTLETFILNGRRCIEHYSGGYAVVFKFFDKIETWAFRCWFSHVCDDIIKRLELISKYLKSINLPYFCDFMYEEHGILVNGISYPTTRMRWIEGNNLNDYIWKHRNDSHLLSDLAKEFFNMCMLLHKHNIAHGDLQYANLIITDENKICLIDYDSMYVPDLTGRTDVIQGQKNYQHPARKKNKLLSPKADYFSELIIYIGIVAVATDGALANEFNINSEGWFFNEQDYLNLSQSKGYIKLHQLGGVFPELLHVLEIYLSKSDINLLEPFYSYIPSLSNIDSQYCINCGTEFLDSDDNYCIECGTKRVCYV